MTLIGPQPPMHGPQNPYPQPVTYRPGVPMGAPVGYNPGYGAPDQYRPGPVRPGMPGAPGMPQQQEPPYEYVSQKDVAFGLLGAVGGFFAAGLIGVSGPIGALIFGVALLGLSMITRGISHMKAKKAAQQQPQPPQQMPQPPQYPYPGQTAPGQGYQYQNQYNYQQDYMQQQQQQQRYQYPR